MSADKAEKLPELVIAKESKLKGCLQGKPIRPAVAQGRLRNTEEAGAGNQELTNLKIR
jgi:hypothetical protein